MGDMLYTVVMVFASTLAGLNAQDLNCDFESGYCSWTTPVSSDRNWTRSNIESRSPGTGPSTGHTHSGTDFYIYLFAEDFQNEATNLIDPGRCVLTSAPFNTSRAGGCFTFWYYMHGLGVGNLSVGMVPQVTFIRQGEQGSAWQCGYLSVDENRQSVQIEITARTGPNIQGDIALDDFRYYQQRCTTLSDPCSNVITSEAPTSTQDSPGGITQTETQSSPDVTSSAVSSLTTQATENDETILYVAIVPVVVFIIGGLIALYIYRRRKSKEKRKARIFATEWTRRGNQHEQFEEPNQPEEYDTINETAMNDDYTELPDIPDTFDARDNHTGNNTGVSNGRALASRHNEAFDDDDSEGEYVEPVNGPVNHIPEIRVQHAPDSFRDPSNPEHVSQNWNVREQSQGRNGGAFDLAPDGSDLNSGRDSPVPDYDYDYVDGIPRASDNILHASDNFPHSSDVDSHPPRCGPSSGYIRAVHEDTA